MRMIICRNEVAVFNIRSEKYPYKTWTLSTRNLHATYKLSDLDVPYTISTIFRQNVEGEPSSYI